MSSNKEYLDLLTEDVKPIKLGNTNKSGECGMCGRIAKQLYPRNVGNVDFMICGYCKSIME